MIIDIRGGEEIFKGKGAERKMKQVTKNILRNNSIYELEERCPWKKSEEETVSCEQ